MTEAQAIELVAQRFASQWPTLSGDVPFAIENEAFPAVDTFAVLSWQHLSSQQITMGHHPKYERRGMIWVKIWTPSNAGRQASATLCDVARAIFEGQRLAPADNSEPLIVYTGLTREAGSDSRWYTVAAQFPASYTDQA